MNQNILVEISTKLPTYQHLFRNKIDTKTMIENNKTARKAQSEFSAKMKLRSSALVVIICSILVQLANIPYYSFLLHAAKYGPISTTILNSLQGSMYLLFPLLGHLADVYLTRSCAMKCGLMILTGSMLYLTVFTLF